MKHRFAVEEYFNPKNSFCIPEGWRQIASFVRLEDALSFISFMRLSGRQMRFVENKGKGE